MTKRHWIRRSVAAGGILLLLLVAAAVVLVATFDANRYKTLAIDWMTTEHQRTLAIDGPVELSLWPRLALKVSQLRLSERGSDDEFMAADEAALAVQVLPLLRKQLVIDRVSARGVRASYLRDAQGVRNFDDLVAGGSAAAAAASASASAPAPGAPALRFDVAAVQLDDLQLRLRDETLAVAGELTLQSFTSGRLAPGSASPVALRATVQLTQPRAVKLVLDGIATVALDLAKDTVTMSGLKVEVQGDAAGVTGLSLALEGALAWDGTALRAAPLHVALKGATLGATALAPSTLDVRRALVSAGGQRFELDALKVALAGRQGSRSFELSLDWPQLVVDEKALTGSAISGRFQLAGPTALAGSYASAVPSGTIDALRLPGLAVTLNGSAGQRQFEGSAKADAVLGVGRGAAVFEHLEARVTFAGPGLPPLQLAAAGKASADAEGVRWTLAGALNADRFDSSGRATFAGAVPRVEADARFDKLDLNRLLAPGPPAPSAAAAAGTPLQFGPLNAFDGQFTLAAGKLVFRHYRAADIEARATLDQGALQVSRLVGRAWGGRVEASGSADARSRRVAVKFAASGVDVDALLKDLTGKELLAGTGRVVADVHSSGDSFGALRQHLAGSVALQVRDGAIKGANLTRALRQAQAAWALRQDATSKASAAERTDFSELSASARIADGVAHSDDLDVKSRFLHIGGSGRFDIGRGRVDYTARVTGVAAAAGHDGAELPAALHGAVVPVVLSGPFDAIDWKIQWSRVAAAALESRLKEKIAEKLGARLGTPPAAAGAASAPATPQDRLRERLKGLLR